MSLLTSSRLTWLSANGSTMHFLFFLLFYLGLLFAIKGEILSLRRLYSLEQLYKCVVSHRQSHHKNRFCCDLRAIDPRRVVGIPPARSEGLIARQKAARRKGPVSSWQPSPSTCRFISSRLSRNKLECDGCRGKLSRVLCGSHHTGWHSRLATNASIISCMCISRLIPVWRAALVW